MKIGFIGLGIMGKPMAKNLIKGGHELLVCDFSAAAVAELTALEPPLPPMGLKLLQNAKRLSLACCLTHLMLGSAFF